ncbi:MAG: hypothetical protein HYZ71_01730 [Deltaproteobacteria bacterium]|nr:hypothetical protein [Deltaproteobacteria bacterium]
MKQITVMTLVTLLIHQGALAEREVVQVSVSSAGGNNLLLVTQGKPYAFTVANEGWRFVDTVNFSARAKTSASKVTVSADGEVRCNLDLTGTLANQSCTVNRTSRVITIGHVSGDDAFVSQLVTLQSKTAPQKMGMSGYSDFGLLSKSGREPLEYSTKDLPEVDPPTGAQVAQYLAKYSIDVVRLMAQRLKTGEDDNGDPLPPPPAQVTTDLESVKIVATAALASVRPNKDLSFTTLFKMLRLQKQIDGIGDTIVYLLKRDDTYNPALTLMTIREYIEDRLDTHIMERMMEKDPETLKKLLSEEPGK